MGMSQVLIKTARPVVRGEQVDLTKRRTWHDGEGDAPEPEKPAEQQQPETPARPEWVADPDKAYAEIQKLRRENAAARQAEKRLAELEAAQREADEKRLADANEWKTLAEQRAQKLAELEVQARDAELKALRVSIAAELGLPAKWADRLKGDTEEALRQDAAELKESLPSQPQQPPAPGARTPTTTTVPGGKPAGETDAQRRARLFGGNSTMFAPRADGVIYHGDAADLE